MVAGFAAGTFAAVVQTDSDGMTFDVTDGVLTITVPSGKINSGYDYVANILNQASYAVTQVVKDGAGTLVPKAAPNYEGQWRVKVGVVDVQVANAFAFAAGARVTIPVGTSRKGVHTLITTAGGITGTPGVTGPDCSWEVRVEGNSLVAEHVSGAVIFVK